MLTSILNAMLPALTMATMGQAYYHGSGSIAPARTMTSVLRSKTHENLRR